MRIQKNYAKNIPSRYSEALKEFHAKFPEVESPSIACFQEDDGRVSDIIEEDGKVTVYTYDSQKEYSAYYEAARWESEETTIVYTDGSFRNGRYSYGYFIPALEYESYGVGRNKEAAKARNVAGELSAVMRAIKYCFANGRKHLMIRHDYEGVSCWACGAWKAKNEITKAYVDFVKKYTDKGMVVEFEHVKGHSGDLFNEYADELAKRAFAA